MFFFFLSSISDSGQNEFLTTIKIFSSQSTLFCIQSHHKIFLSELTNTDGFTSGTISITSHELRFELLLMFFRPFIVWHIYSHKQNGQGLGLFQILPSPQNIYCSKKLKPSDVLTAASRQVTSTSQDILPAMLKSSHVRIRDI